MSAKLVEDHGERFIPDKLSLEAFFSGSDAPLPSSNPQVSTFENILCQEKHV